MACLRCQRREILRKFLSLLETLPCLWQVKHKDYSDRNKKAEAYDALVTIYKGIDPTCTREIVEQKIDILKTVYRNESERAIRAPSGSAADQIFKPCLWYYDMLHFLRDQDTPRVSPKNTKEDSDSEEQEHLEDIRDENVNTQNSFSSKISTSPCRMVSRSASKPSSTSRKRKRETNDETTNEVLKLIVNKIQWFETDDDFSTFGKHVANKLRSISAEQNVVAQKLICDVLYEAQLGLLTTNNQRVNM
ncbi:uncharacterized protein LOC128270569 [Anopheles cruzii]|uniref:uncharacterized protein LOC128270569 n=1 Tax=Anopheles cruzii TaxID=68878 RepID=UPI0022EC4090|nr:uncharacterized protein LOC128270569 [Anopheles cruzii]